MTIQISCKLHIAYHFRLQTGYFSTDLCGNMCSSTTHTHINSPKTELNCCRLIQFSRLGNVLNSATATAWMTRESISIGGGDFSV